MPKPATLPFTEQLFQPGQRVAIAVSGGADSTALLRTLVASRDRLGLVLSVLHVHHGIRAEAADSDQAFVEALANEHGLTIYLRRVDTPAHAATHNETIEEAARNLRYGFFRELLDAGLVDAVATAHTLDDQAETVLHKFLRGAWTEGLGGISPVVSSGKGRGVNGQIIRPLLGVSHSEVETYLRILDQGWCEDATNLDLAHTRNRLRHHLLPLLAEYNPQLSTQLSRLATIARDEEAWWQREVARVGTTLVLPGKPVRGGGRASSTHPDEVSIAFELERLRALDPAMRRRVLRWAAQQVRTMLDFHHTERLMQMCEASANAPKRVDVDGSVYAQRTARELQFVRHVL
jgi:tRNA(Ile)-lysidine synthase